MTYKFYTDGEEHIEVIPVFEDGNELVELLFCIGTEMQSLDISDFERLVKVVELTKNKEL
jgi:hypothetical protein